MIATRKGATSPHAMNTPGGRGQLPSNFQPGRMAERGAMLRKSKSLAFDETNLVSSICRDNFFEFVKEFWETIIAEIPVWNWHIEFLCNELQKIAERVIEGLPKENDLVVNIPPGTTKSTIVSILYPCWVWTRFPQARFICASYEDSLATDLARKSRMVLKSEKFQTCFPGIEFAPDQDTKHHFANTRGGMRFSVGTGGSCIGRHAHFILIDDPIDPTAALSIAEIRKANIWLDEHISQRKVDKKITVTMLIMQRLHQDDAAANMLKKGKDTKHINLPAELPEETDELIKVKPRSCRKYYVDGLLDPIRLSATVIANEEKRLGTYGKAAQYDQNPVPRGGGMFKTGMIHRDKVPPQKFIATVRAWDKAGTKGGGAFSVGLKMGLAGRRDAPEFWILDVIRGQWNSAERERILCTTARIDGKGTVIVIEQEPGSGGKESAEATVSRLAGYRFRIDKPSASEGSKELRADPASVQVNNGNFYIAPNMPWVDELINEMMFFPFSTYKDQVDALAAAFNWITRRKIIGAIR